MRVMVDSNVIVSALVFRSSNMGRVIERICQRHVLCIASCCLEEVRDVMAAKFTRSSEGLDEFFAELPHTVIETPVELGEPLFSIRDSGDYAVLHTAVVGQVDLFVTGDKDFHGVKIDRPQILTPLEFLERY